MLNSSPVAQQGAAWLCGEECYWLRLSTMPGLFRYKGLRAVSGRSMRDLGFEPQIRSVGRLGVLPRTLRLNVGHSN